jgi:tripeptidyl-peptidase-1
LQPGYSVNGRGYPDVSLFATNYQIVELNKIILKSSTYASTPVMAGLVSLINARRYAIGKQSVGWLNPSLYLYYKSFVNDVVSGNNKCASGGDVCCSQGFFFFFSI